MTDTSSSRHNLGHLYAENGDAFPGWPGHGQTAQSIGRPEVLAQAEVGPPAAARRTDRKPQTTRARKSAPRKRTI
jgi:hypothetical protein